MRKVFKYQLVALMTLICGGVSAQVELWPGDANNNGIVDELDIITIGMYYGEEGEMWLDTLDDDDIFFEEYEAEEWGELMYNDEDIVHADCNGDGIIDEEDVLIVLWFFDEFHGRNNPQNSSTQSSNTLYLEMEEDSVAPGGTATINVIMSGSADTTFNSYGLSYAIRMNPEIAHIDEEIVTWDMIHEEDEYYIPHVDDSNGIMTVEVAEPHDGAIFQTIVKIDGQEDDFVGPIASFKTVIEDDLDGSIKRGDLGIELADVKLVSSTGGSQEVVTVGTTFAIEGVKVDNDTTSNVADLTAMNELKFYPNPVNKYLFWKSGKLNVQEMAIINTLGESVVIANVQQRRVDVSALSAGIYYVDIKTDKGQLVKKFLIQE